MANFKYLIIGGGMTADSATRGIRESDPSGSIGLVGVEPDPPYDRPPLSKKLWSGTPFESIWRKTKDRGVELLLGRRVTSIDLARKTVADSNGETHGYEKLLLTPNSDSASSAADSSVRRLRRRSPPSVSTWLW